MLTLSRKFPKKRAFITGAGSGLGQALAYELARDGWTLALNDLRAAPLDETCAEVRRLGGAATAHVFDVTDRAAYARVVDDLVASLGGVDLVVNNAGVAGGGLVGEFTLDDWDWLLRINLLGVVNGCHLFAPVLKAQRSGHILNVASAAALVPVPGMAAYCSAKAGVKMLSEVLCSELHSDGVGVSVLMPEFFRTNLAERTRGPEQAAARMLIESARYAAAEVARAALEQCGSRRLHIVFPARTRLIWALLRLAPAGALALIRAGAAQQRKRVERRKAA
jgi:NADP-dependent 3-hydroxy acid dehydrogenase YdfG